MELDDLYQEIILDHFKDPRGKTTLNESEVQVEEYNPTCGDQIKMAVETSDGRISDIRYDGKGCAISMASASMMAEALTGESVDSVRAMIQDFVKTMRGEGEPDADAWGDIMALAGVRRYPMRIKCATMCWHALDKALALSDPSLEK